MPRVHVNKGKSPRNTDIPLGIKFANGWNARQTYTADQLRWTLTGCPWDISNFWRADGKDADES